MKLITISDQQRLSVSLLDYGARITRIRFAEVDVALGYPSIQQYAHDPFYMGATVGPICNRISKASLNIEGEDYRLPANEGVNCLHSGGRGFDKELWAVKAHGPSQAEFGLSYDLTKIGLRGTLECLARYTVANGCLTIDYLTRCDQTTYVNLTNHVYLNLSGAEATIDDHCFELNAASFLNVDEQKLPNGTLTTLPNPCQYQFGSEALDAGLNGNPCDYHFNARDELMARISCASSGLNLEVCSNLPGYQFYTGTHLSEPFTPASGFCIETQHPPDAINQRDLEAPLLRPGDIRTTTTRYQFSQEELLA